MLCGWLDVIHQTSSIYPSIHKALRPSSIYSNIHPSAGLSNASNTCSQPANKSVNPPHTTYHSPIHHPINRPDMTFAVDWALKTNYLSIIQSPALLTNDSKTSTKPLTHRAARWKWPWSSRSDRCWGLPAPWSAPSLALWSCHTSKRPQVKVTNSLATGSQFSPFAFTRNWLFVKGLGKKKL